MAKKFYEIGPSGVDLIELFDINLPTLFCKIDLLMTKQQILCMLMQWSSFQKSVSKFKAKKFYEIDSRLWFEMQKFWKEVFATWVWANTVHTDAQNQTVWPSLAEN
jgi:hypothetical protein